jgi:hypothetical protein
MERGLAARVPTGTCSRRLRAREVRTRGVQAGGLKAPTVTARNRRSRLPQPSTGSIRPITSTAPAAQEFTGDTALLCSRANQHQLVMCAARAPQTCGGSVGPARRRPPAHRSTPLLRIGGTGRLSRRSNALKNPQPALHRRLEFWRAAFKHATCAALNEKGR